MRCFSVVVLTPAGAADASLAIAASRAGARGFLDLEYAPEFDAALDEVRRLERFTAGPFGIKLGRDSAEFVSRLTERPPSRLKWVLLAGGDHTELAGWVQAFRDRQIEVYLEAIRLSEALRGEQLGVDGLILKGHEAGGRVGPETSFILLQQWHKYVTTRRSGDRGPNDTVLGSLPVWIQGGIGLNTAAACAVAGVQGVVLDAQLLLSRESPLSEAGRRQLASFDGSETLCVGERLGEAYRFFSRPGLSAVDELARKELELLEAPLSAEERLAAWRQEVRRRVGRDCASGLWLIGQDAAFASRLAEHFVTVGGVVQALTERTRRQLVSARQLTPLAEGSPLAQRHGTRYPIVQGPMTRVSDTAAFAESVAKAGGLPFLALALMRRAEAEKLLQETRERLGKLPWGAGILGFAPPEIRREQTEAIRAMRPPFALIAGGRPDQARELEKEGIPTYLHVPSPGLLKMFLRDGARRFIFEGRECGGHVGPRSSFVLWETMCEVLLETQARSASEGKAADLHVLFAGGIHDALSAAMVSALGATLAERGVSLGVLLGTAYLFTQEAVDSGAIVPQFQREALRCRETVLLETGPGHAIRCVNTPYLEKFEQEKRRLQRAGKSNDEIREALEAMNIGRLRIASKGVDRAPGNEAGKLSVPSGKEEIEAGRAGGASPSMGTRDPRAHAARSPRSEFVMLSEEEQRTRGMYMIGQVATLRDQVVTMAQLHADISDGSRKLLEAYQPEGIAETAPERPCDVAIVGMACVMPKAGSLEQYWHNILHCVDAITEVPLDHWDWRLYYDPNPRAKDKISSKWGGFLDDMPFDPLVYGMPPNSLNSIEPIHLFLLETVRRALADAGYADRAFDRERTAVILGAGGGAAQLAMAYGFRSYLPMLDTVPGAGAPAAELLKKCEGLLPEWTEDSFPGILLNVAAGRVANRFNFGGPNFSIDAACGSSLAALYAAVKELEMGTSDTVVLMGADTVQNPFTYMLFSKTHAFSPRGRCSTFDESADGIVISEGVAVVVLKRLADAERDGDRIYAVIKGVGASSDGKDKGLTAPRPEGQLRALRRAYAKAGISPARVGLIEAHGTGTVVGDQTEVQSLAQIMREAGAAPRGCAVGSVKSMIGHTKCAAGLAGLINATLALHHKTLPPLLVNRPNSKAKFEESPLFLNTEARPWIHGHPDHPRTAGVSAFGFGGTNYHAVLEEYTGNYLSETPPALRTWPAELFVWRKPTRAALIEAVEACHRALEKGAKPEPRDLAYSLWQAAQVSGGRESLEQSKDSGDSRVPLARMAIVAISLEDLQEKLAQALKGLRANQDAIHDPRGVYVSGGHSALRTPHSAMPKVAFLFPGQGSQYPNMLAQLALVFAEVRQAFDNAERTLTGKYDRPLGKFIFPPSTFTPEQEAEARRAITRTDVAQPAIGAASLGMLHLLQRLGLQPDFLAGHSYGDYVALCAAGALSEEDLIRLSYERGRVIVEASGQMPGSMAAIEANLETVAKVIAGIDGVTAANINTPSQTVISGTNEGVQAALERFQKRGIRGQKLPVACGFHSPSVAPAREPFAKALAACRFAPPRRPVYANTTAAPYPPDPAALAALLAEHLTSPVQFLAEVEALYAAGARIFVEVGPQGVLTGLVGQILAGRPHLAVTGDVKGRPGLVQLQHLLAQLLTEGLPLRLDRLYQNRQCKALDLANLDQETGQVKHSPTTWLVNSVRVRPWNAPEPQFLGKPCGEPASRPPGGLAEPSSKPASELIPPVTRTPISSRSPAPISAMSNPTPTPNCNGLPPQPPAPVSGGEAAQVMMRFQDLMARFLDTQRNVMLSYLQGSGGTAAVGPSLPPLSLPTPLPTPAAANGHPPAPPAPASVGTAAPQSEPPPVSAPPPPPKPEPLVAKVERKPEGVDREELTTRLLDIVRQRTGYPLEMLGLDLDLEADLGIDSIKRVEILGSLTESSGADSNGTTPEMEKLTGIKTLRGIIDCLAGAEASRPKHGTARQGTDRAVPESICQVPEMSAGAGRDRGGIQRMLVVAEDVSLPSATPLLPVGTILVTDDGKGVARALAARLREMGQTVALLRMVAGAELTAQGATFQADLTEPRAVEALLHRVRQQMGPVAGLVHLLPLAEPAARETWNQRVNREVKSLFLLARGLADELCRCASEGRALLLAATSMGQPASRECEPSDDHGDSGASRPPLGVASGGVGGIVKSLAHEWPEVLVRVIDVDVTSPAAELAERLLAELGDPEGPVEVAYHGPRRTAWQCVPAPVDLSVPPALSLEADSTILLTGGARGITAAVALELARRYRPNLVLVGRSPLPQAEESPDTMGLTAAADLKAALIGRLRREGSTVTPAAVEAAYHRLLQDREIRGNLARLRETGAQVHYYSADVRDELAFAAVIDEVYRRFGRIDGVIHGAGVIQDKLIRDKTPESFDRVFGTKVDSALILSRHLRPESLRFCLFFASVAGRFGNRGQSDYAAANEVLTKLAAALDRRWPGRVASVVWGPWSSIGMVAELEAHLGQRGLQMIPPEVGPLFLVEELTHGRKGEVEVVIAGDVGQLARRSGTRSARAGKQEPIGAKQ